MSTEYRELELRLRALVASLRPPMTESQANEVLHFVDVGEYGVALETLGSLMGEEGLKPSTNSLGEMKRLAKEMEVDASDWKF